MYDFLGLFIFEMANSHQGSMEHGAKIITEFAKIQRKYNIKAAIKLQYRHLDSFIHPDYKGTQIKHIARFESTRLSFEQFNELVSRIKNEGLIAMSTPFDEIGVDWCVQQGLDIIKIASCSAADWPLLEKAVESRKPLIVSTGGKTLQDIDNLYTFFTHKAADFAFLHCVAEYPVSAERIQLDFIERMRKRYPGVEIGYSGHEAPDDTLVSALAYAKGGRIFERHIGLPSETSALNAYSMNPAQTEKWVESILESKNICELKNGDTKLIRTEERESLRSLERGCFVNKNIVRGKEVTKRDVFFAMPLQEGQMTSGEFDNQIITATRDYVYNAPLVEKRKEKTAVFLRGIIHDVTGLLRESNVALGNDFEVELSHHYGIEKFRDFGAVIISVINREYCKKYIIVLPKQKHPSHFHRQKEEAFQVLYGAMDIEIMGEKKHLERGDIQIVYRGARHSFYSNVGVVFEEISTTHIKNDSFYEDPNIAKLDLIERKTYVKEWFPLSAH